MAATWMVRQSDPPLQTVPHPDKSPASSPTKWIWVNPTYMVRRSDPPLQAVPLPTFVTRLRPHHVKLTNFPSGWSASRIPHCKPSPPHIKSRLSHPTTSTRAFSHVDGLPLRTEGALWGCLAASSNPPRGWSALAHQRFSRRRATEPSQFASHCSPPRVLVSRIYPRLLSSLTLHSDVNQLSQTLQPTKIYNLT